MENDKSTLLVVIDKTTMGKFRNICFFTNKTHPKMLSELIEKYWEENKEQFKQQLE